MKPVCHSLVGLVQDRSRSGVPRRGNHHISSTRRRLFTASRLCSRRGPGAVRAHAGETGSFTPESQLGLPDRSHGQWRWPTYDPRMVFDGTALKFDGRPSNLVATAVAEHPAAAMCMNECSRITCRRFVSYCILLYSAYVFSKRIRIRQRVKGQGVDTCVGLYSAILT